MSQSPPQLCFAISVFLATQLVNTFAHAAALGQTPPSWPGTLLGTAGSPMCSQRGFWTLRKFAIGTLPILGCSAWLGTCTSYVPGLLPLPTMLQLDLLDPRLGLHHDVVRTWLLAPGRDVARDPVSDVCGVAGHEGDRRRSGGSWGFPLFLQALRVSVGTQFALQQH
mmetsp:Transcript_35397/g.101709  ORF Transcript_35397/g.101709 Transcript_35397/m.101709 type:complete len:167 (+) Transcript_35397:1039-1539(+)